MTAGRCWVDGVEPFSMPSSLELEWDAKLCKVFYTRRTITLWQVSLYLVSVVVFADDLPTHKRPK